MNRADALAAASADYEESPGVTLRGLIRSANLTVDEFVDAI